MHILSLTDSARVAYGELRHDLERRGVIIEPLDMLSAAPAIFLNAILVTTTSESLRGLKT